MAVIGIHDGSLHISTEWERETDGRPRGRSCYDLCPCGGKSDSIFLRRLSGKSHQCSCGFCSRRVMKPKNFQHDEVPPGEV